MSILKNKSRFLFFVGVFFYATTVFSAPRSSKDTSGVRINYLEKGKDLRSIDNSEQIPASLVKVFTAAHALFTFGKNYKFQTKIYLTESNEIGIEGVGDPGLTSEVLSTCIDDLLRYDLNRKFYQRIILDNSKFDPDLIIPGQGESDNPYDATVSALGINFNSVALKVEGKTIFSGEDQTPLTQYAKSIGAGMKSGNYRISIKGTQAADRQFAEVLSSMLNERGIKLGSQYEVKQIPQKAKLIVSCQSQNIGDQVKAMLKYSNNYTANQLFLNAGANYYGYPASLNNSRKAMQKFIKEELGIKGSIIIEEGSGLSRGNRFSPQQMMVLLKYFEPHRNLLPESKGVYYKSGTLTGVSNLAGYLTKNDEVLGYFALFGNSYRPIEERVSIISKLKGHE